MIILGIETSCDETAVAVVERGRKNLVRAERIKSQEELHSPYGGIVPEIASRNHLEYIDRLTVEALADARLTLGEIDLIALTLGPGLIGSLLIGLSFAKGLALSRNLPIIPVDHIQAHVEAAFISHPKIEYPLLALVVSGGHTTLFYQESKLHSDMIAKTRDDAAGEVMDKVAKHFGLGYPGGPILDQICPGGDPGRYPFTFPRISDGTFDFSFSGYKTAVLRIAQKNGIEAGTRKFRDLVASFLHSIVAYLFSMVESAAAQRPVRSLVVAGGVSRNTLLRKRFQEECEQLGLPLYLPEPRFCTDNAAMIAWLGYEWFRANPDGPWRDLTISSYSRARFRETGRHR